MSIGETILPYLSVTALASTVGLFLCGLQICQRIRLRGTTEGTGSAPFLIAFISCAFFLEYGLVKKDDVIFWNNVIGLALQTSYVVYYYRMTRNKRWLNRMIGFELVAIFTMVWYVNIGAASPEDAESHLGFVCILMNIASVGAPLLEVGKVIRTKSSESMPLPLCIACFVVSVQWLMYGIIVDDVVIKVPNYIATAISIIQLSLFAIYPRHSTVGMKKYSRLSDNNNIEDMNI